MRSLFAVAAAGALCTLLGTAAAAQTPGYTNVHVEASPEHEVRYASDHVIYLEGLVDGRWVGRYWSPGGRINDPYEHYADNAFDLQIDNVDLKDGWSWVRNYEIDKPGQRHFIVELKNAHLPVDLRIHTLLDGTPVIERWLEITNDSQRPMAIDAVCPWAGRLFSDPAYAQALGPRDAAFTLGSFVDISHGWEGRLAWQPLVNQTVEVASHVGHGFRTPLFVVRNNAMGQYFIGEFGWSGNWTMEFRAQETAPESGATHESHGPGEADLWFKVGLWSPTGEAMRVLAAGSSVSTPILHLGYVEGDLDLAAQAMAKHVRRSVLPKRDPKRAYLIQYAVPADQGYADTAPNDQGMTEASMLRQIDLAAATGAQLFIVDAGWWNMYGDWTPSPTRFPHGLQPIIDAAHQKGMLFGLYNEVTGGRGGWKRCAVCKAHPDWFLKPYQLLDLTNPAVAAYVKSEIEKMIERYHLDLFRLDYNPGFDDGMGYVMRDGIKENDYWRYYDATYKIFEQIKAEFPELILQQAAAGGGRNDLGLAARFDEDYLTDGLDVPPVLENFSGQTLGLPPEVFVTALGLPAHPPNWGPLATHLQLTFSLGTPWLSALAPSLADLNPEVRATYVHYADVYKSFIRPLLPTCVVYHDAPISDRHGVGQSPWFAMEFDAPDKSRGWATIVRIRPDGPESYVFRAQGLDPSRTYRVTFESTGAAVPIRGLSLMQQGLRIPLTANLSSEMLLFQAE